MHEQDEKQQQAAADADAESPQVNPAAAPEEAADEGAAALDPIESAPAAEPASDEKAAEPADATDEAADESTEESERDEPAEAPFADGLTVEQVVEALLFATDSPVPAAKVAQILERGTARHVRAAVKQLNSKYEQARMAFRIEEVAGGYQMLTLPKFQPWLARLLRARQDSKLSPAQMETLAVVAYKQPVLRADIEAIRGVACGDVINKLRELGLVKIVGRAEDVGRPLLYGTTRKFLRVFGLGGLEDLPRVEELRPPAAPAGQQAGEAPAGERGAAAQTAPAQPAPLAAAQERAEIESPDEAAPQDAGTDEPEAASEPE